MHPCIIVPVPNNIIVYAVFGVERMQSRGERAFTVYLAGQGVSNLGDAFRFISVTILIFKLTGSGMEAALGLALSTLPSIILSPFAGVLGDRIDEKHLLVLTDFARFLTVPLFLWVNSVVQVYMLLILLSLFDILYSPSKRKFVLGLTGREGALKANSLLTGVSGAAYLVGPLAAGILTDTYGTVPAIIIAGLCCLCSGLVTIAAGIVFGRKGQTGINIKCADMPGQHGGRQNTAGRSVAGKRRQSVSAELKKGFEYCLTMPDVKNLLLIGLVTGFCTISINLSFYPFAFDILKVTAKGWSLMITVYYGTNLMAMLLLKYSGAYLKGSGGRLFYSGLCIVSLIWAFYAIAADFAVVLVLQFIEGTVIAICGILLAARYQTVTDRGFMARVSGINDIFSNFGRLAGMGCTAVITVSFPLTGVFILNSIILFLFAAYGLACSRWVRSSPAPGAKIRY